MSSFIHDKKMVVCIKCQVVVGNTGQKVDCPPQKITFFIFVNSIVNRQIMDSLIIQYWERHSKIDVS